MSEKKTIRVKKIKSESGSVPKLKACIVGLGLNKMNRVRVLEDTPAIRGMIAKVSHLVKVVDDEA